MQFLRVGSEGVVREWPDLSANGGLNKRDIMDMGSGKLNGTFEVRFGFPEAHHVFCGSVRNRGGFYDNDRFSCGHVSRSEV